MLPGSALLLACQNIVVIVDHAYNILYGEIPNFGTWVVIAVLEDFFIVAPFVCLIYGVSFAAFTNLMDGQPQRFNPGKMQNELSFDNYAQQPVQQMQVAGYQGQQYRPEFYGGPQRQEWVGQQVR